MAEQCPECGAATEAAPWCASCGAWLGDAPVQGERRGVRHGRLVVVAVVAAVAAAVFVALGADDDGAEVPAAGEVVPVEDAEVVPPTTPPMVGPVGRQFAVEAVVVWQRRLTAAADATWTLATTEEGVALLDDGRPVLSVDAASGQEVSLPGVVPAPGDLVFDGADGPLTVEAGTDVLRGVVAGEVVWRVDLGSPTAVAPIRAGTSVVVALTSGEVRAISPADGSDRWRRDLGAVPTAAAGDGTILLVGTADGRVLRLDPSGVPVTTAQVGEDAVLAMTAGRPAVVLLADRLLGLDVAG